MGHPHNLRAAQRGPPAGAGGSYLRFPVPEPQPVKVNPRPGSWFVNRATVRPGPGSGLRTHI